METESRLIHNSSFRDLLLSYNHLINWSQPLSMNYAAIHQLSLILLFYSGKKTSQPLLMAFGRLVNLMSQADITDDGIQYVLGGVALLQCIPWSCRSTYGDICHQYTEYVARKYRNAIVVFDGYDSTNTKKHDTPETVGRKGWCNCNIYS